MNKHKIRFLIAIFAIFLLLFLVSAQDKNVITSPGEDADKNSANDFEDNSEGDRNVVIGPGTAASKINLNIPYAENQTITGNQIVRTAATNTVELNDIKLTVLENGTLVETIPLACEDSKVGATYKVECSATWEVSKYAGKILVLSFSVEDTAGESAEESVTVKVGSADIHARQVWQQYETTFNQKILDVLKKIDETEQKINELISLCEELGDEQCEDFWLNAKKRLLEIKNKTQGLQSTIQTTTEANVTEQILVDLKTSINKVLSDVISLLDEISSYRPVFIGPGTETCEDTTLINYCSRTRPLYCQKIECKPGQECEPELRNRCDICGCPNGFECTPKGTCEAIGAVCGNGLCEEGENCETCAEDCGECQGVCGDGICDASENLDSCYEDCIAEVCGEHPAEEKMKSYEFEEGGEIKNIESFGRLLSLEIDGKKTISDMKMLGNLLKSGVDVEVSDLATNKYSFIVELEDSPLYKYELESFSKSAKDAKAKEIEDKQQEIFKSIQVSPQVKMRKSFAKIINALVVDVPEKDIEEFSKKLNADGIKRVMFNREVEYHLLDSVPLIGADQLWQNGFDGTGIKVAVIDTGVDYTHSDLGGCTTEVFLNGNCTKVAGGYDIINQDEDPIDTIFHGTHVAATIAGEGTLSGVAPGATIYAYKVFENNMQTTQDIIIEGIERAIDPNQDNDFSDRAEVINMSLGGGGDANDPLSEAANNAVSLGAVVVVSAGNSGGHYTIGSPGAAENVITVGATDDNDKLADFSSGGPTTGSAFLVKPDLTAPGVLICAARYDEVFPLGEHPSYGPCIDEQHLQVSGTSMSAPHVAGAAALLIQAHPEWTTQDIKSTLVGYAKTIDTKDIYRWGAGRLDAEAALDAQIITVPSSLSFGLIDAATTIPLQVKNISEKEIFVEIPESLNFSAVNGGAITVNLTVAEPSFCLEPGQEMEIEIAISNFDAVDYGDYSSLLELDGYEDCTLKENNFTIGIPTGFSKHKKISIEINPRQHVAAEYDGARIMFVSDGSTIESSIVGLDEDSMEWTLLTLTDQLADIGYGSFESDLEMGKVRDLFIVKGINLSTDETIAIDEYAAQKTETNLGEIMNNNNLKEYETRRFFKMEDGALFGTQIIDHANCKSISFENELYVYEENPHLSWEVLEERKTKIDGYSFGDSRVLGLFSLSFPSPLNPIKTIANGTLQSFTLKWEEPSFPEGQISEIKSAPKVQYSVGGSYLNYMQVIDPLIEKQVLYLNESGQKFLANSYYVINSDEWKWMASNKGLAEWGKPDLTIPVPLSNQNIFEGPYFFEMSITDGRIIFGYLYNPDLGEKINSRNIFGKTSLTVTAPSGQTVDASSALNGELDWWLNCDSQTSKIVLNSEVLFDSCDSGTYTFTWQADDLLAEDPNAISKQIMFDGTYWEGVE